jgi:hypothetical protein
VFGPEESFNRYLGRCFNLFSLPNYAGFSHEGIMFAEPGRMAGVYAIGDSDTVYAILTFAIAEPPFLPHRDLGEQPKRTAGVFAESGCETPRLVEAIQGADALYFDTVSQIHMPGWSSGRVVLVGDAAHAPSFLSGQAEDLSNIEPGAGAELPTTLRTQENTIMKETPKASHIPLTGTKESLASASTEKQTGRLDTSIGHVGLHATNPAATAKFYRDVFGMEITGGSSPDHPLGATAFLTSRHGEEPHAIVLAANPEVTHTAFKVSSLAEFRSFHARVEEKKIAPLLQTPRNQTFSGTPE